MKKFYLPDLGEGLAEAEIREWYVKVGDAVNVDQPLASMETAKAIVDVPSPYKGKILALHGNVNEVIKTGASFIDFELEESKEKKVSRSDKGSVVGKLESSERKWDDGDVLIGVQKVSNKTVKAMPAARMLASAMQIDLTTLTATGPGGLVTVDDVKRAQGGMVSLQTDLPHRSSALHGVRRVMAQSMMQSHREIVPVTLFEDANITHLPAETDLTVVILHAMVKAAKIEPTLNAWFDSKTLELKLFEEVHIGLAVDSDEGLFVPVIKNIGKYNATDLRKKIDEIKTLVKSREIPAKDMQGATITLSNFGMITGRYATPIIVPPAVSILGCGRVREEPIVEKGKIVVGRLLPLSLTFDHRAVTGGEATRYLKAVIECLSSSG